MNDKDLILQNDIKYKYKLNIVNFNGSIIDVLYGMSAVGEYSINSDSLSRRSTSFTMLLERRYRDEKISVEDKLYSWIGYNFILYIGVYDIRNVEYIWFPCGKYTITEANTSYSASENSITVNLTDLFSKLDGTKNGVIAGATNTVIRNVDENGNMITIKNVIISLLKKLNTLKIIKGWNVTEVGELNGIDKFNKDYMKYRKLHPEWNQLPYDLSYDIGSSYGDIISDITELYPYCQSYFDERGTFNFKIVPIAKKEIFEMDSEEHIIYPTPELTNDYIQKILLAESTESVDYDITTIKNITQVFGKSYDIDYYIDIDDELDLNTYDHADISYSKNNDCYEIGYSVNGEYYDSYEVGDIFCIKIKDTNDFENMSIKINNLVPLSIVNQSTKYPIEINEIAANEFHNFIIGFVSNDGQTGDGHGNYVMYYLGQYQPMAMCILSDGSVSYEKSYFAEKYNCNEKYIKIRIDEKSPFSIEKIGEIINIKSGDSFDNILSSSMALYNAEYYNKQSTTMMETITISTKMIPFLDVSKVVTYKKANSDNEQYYMIKSISNNLEQMTSSITMYRFNENEYII